MFGKGRQNQFLGSPHAPPLMIIYPLVFFTAAVALDIVYLITSNSFVATLFFGLIAAGVLVD